MPTLLYAPGVRAAIATREHGILDISDDLVSGSLTLTENQPSTFTFQLANHRRKYDRIFTPNDRIAVQMRRVGPYLQNFSGYLDSVPYFSVYPRTVRITATCTLKRLKYRLWDAGAAASWELVNSSFTSDNADLSDQGVKQKVVDLLTKVAEWPSNQIHIGMLPSDWFSRISDLYTTLSDRIGINAALLGSDATIGGEVVPGTGAGSWTGQAGILAPDQFLALIRSQGGSDDEAIELGGTAATESGFKTDAEQKGGKGRGLFQIDLGQHPTITQAQAYDAAFATRWVLEQVRGRVRSGKTLRQACGPNLFYGPRDRPKVADDGRRLIADAVKNAGKAPATPVPVSSPPNTSGGQVMTGDGIRFTSSEGLRPNVFAAKQFVEANWPQMKGSIGGRQNRPSNPGSDHPKGLALDLMVSSGRAQGEERRRGNAMAKFFAENPNVFGTKYVIWYGMIIDTRSGGSWRPYTAFGGHYDHPHVSFKDTGQTAMGPMGSPLPGAAQGPFEGGFLDGTGVPVGGAGGGGLAPVGGAPGSPLNVYNWGGSPSIESETLYGVRALMNDDPILDMIATLMGVTMRSFMSAPNGDFIGWFPDYFGIYGTAGKMLVQDIELQDFSMVWSDDRLITHQYTAGSPYGSSEFESIGGAAVETMQKFMTAGVVSVEFPEVMEALLNIKPGQGAFGDAKKIFERFGARKAYEPMGTIAGEQAEFWYAVHLFQRNWAEQFSTNVPITFMPELFPGMLMVLPSFHFQCYVTQVTHNFDFREGGGFTTDAVVIAPSTTEGGGGIYGLPKSL